MPEILNTKLLKSIRGAAKNVGQPSNFVKNLYAKIQNTAYTNMVVDISTNLFRVSITVRYA